MKRIKRMLACSVIAVICFFSTSCTSLIEETISKVTVEITNEVTNKVVDYENITITDFESAIEETIKSVEKSVVGVTLKEKTYVTIEGEVVPSEDSIGLGSGVIYRREELPNKEGFKYFAVTNRHVVTDDTASGELLIYVYDGYNDTEIPAKVVGYDEKVDVAVIEFEYTKYIDPVEFADSDQIKKGNFVVAMGNPKGYEYYSSATLGIISGDIRYLSEDTDGDNINDFLSLYIQHDAAINPGNSGGGLFTMDGKLVGINTMKLVTVSGADIDNMGFAIPSNVVKTIALEYIEKGVEIVRPRLGITTISVKDLTPAYIKEFDLKLVPEKLFLDGIKYGLYITDNLSAGCSFSNTGIEKHDILLEFDDEKIMNMDIVSAKLNSLVDYKIGDEINIKYYDRSADTIVTETVVLKAQSK